MLKGITKGHFLQCLFWLLLEGGAQNSEAILTENVNAYPGLKI